MQSSIVQLYNMKILADTNVFLAVVLNEPEKRWILEVTRDAELVAPEVLPYEIGNALSAIVKRKGLGSEKALEIEAQVTGIPVSLQSVDIHAALEIAVNHNIYAYDAYFLHCAKAFNCALLTLDRQMLRVARALGIRCLESS